MSRQEQVILTNMCMIMDGQRILVQDRNSIKWSGITFPGGHVEQGESIVASVIREVKEETGLTVSHLELCGFQNWTDLKISIAILCFVTKQVISQVVYSLQRKGRFSGLTMQT